MKIWERFFSRDRYNKYNCFISEITDSGLIFNYPAGWRKKSIQENLAIHQYIFLQQLLESGEAQDTGTGINVQGEVLCRLDSDARALLDLPDAWPGRFELAVSGTTSSRNFSLALWPLPLSGASTLGKAQLRGPYLIVKDQYYLPDAAQWLALEAVASHEAIPVQKRDEATNLKAIYALQQACLQGAAIDLRHFAGLPVEIPQRVGVNVMENRDGSIRLVPDFGSDLAPEAVEERLGQIEGKSSAAALRIGKKIILLDKRRLQATHEILSVRKISAREKLQFFKTPGAWLDAALVDLDTGFSMRVHGMEIFQKAYFGQTDSSNLSWFDENGMTRPDIMFLENCLQLVKDEKDFSELQKLVKEAISKGRASILFAEKIFLLPNDVNEIQQILDKLSDSLKARQKKDALRKEDKTHDEHKELKQVTVKIDLNDENLPDYLPASKNLFHFYGGHLYPEDLKKIMFPYQEEGTRWILGLMNTSSGKKNDFGNCGGLLADDMGMGKTLMALAALNIYWHLMPETQVKKPVLVVMPLILLENWRQEVNNAFKNSPFKDIVILQASAQLQQFRQKGACREITLSKGEQLPPEDHIRYSLKIGKDFGPDRLDIPGRLVLTNYDTLRDYQFSLCMVDWGCVIFDEAQEIKNPNTIKARAAKGLKADFRLAMTGTPVENSLTDFWSLYDTVKPGLLGSFQEFRRKYVLPLKQGLEGSEKSIVHQEIGRQLRKAVGPFMLRRTKEDNLPGLPKKIIYDGMDDSRYCSFMEGLQLQSYNAAISDVLEAMRSGDRTRIQKTILPGLRRLQAISLHPAFMNRNMPTSPDGQINIKNVLYQSAKMVLLHNILDEIRARQEKVIIFVINRAIQRFLAFALGRLYGLNIYTINGETKSITSNSSHGTSSRMELIRRFENQEGFNIICMSPLAAGVGLTVLGANNVIHLERCWNPAKEAQATDRVYRIGAKRDVHVYIPIVKHPEKMSFDVNLNILLKRKTDLKEAVITENDIRIDDFDFGAMFGKELPKTPFLTEKLGNLDKPHFEALVALLVQREWGGSIYLISGSGNDDANVVIEGETNIIIQCRNSIRAFSDSNAPDQLQGAVKEYGRRRGQNFDLAILAINAPQIGEYVREKAKDLGVILMDRPYIDRLLKKYSISCSEVDNLLTEPRMIL